MLLNMQLFVRTVLFSLLLFSTELLILQKWYRSRVLRLEPKTQALWLLVPLFLLWANIHPVPHKPSGLREVVTLSARGADSWTF